MHRKFSLSALIGLILGAALLTVTAIFLSPLQSVFASGFLPGGSSILAIPAKGGLVGSPTIVPPKIVVTSGNASVLGCTATDSNSNPIAISCTPKSAPGSVYLEDVTFTANEVNSAIPLNTYTITYDLDGHPDLTQSIYVGYLPASVTIVASSPSSNFVWNDSDLYATSAGQAVSVLSSDVRSHLNTGNTLIAASGAIEVKSGFTGTTSGNGVTFKGLTYFQANNIPITTANGPVTIWSTNPSTPTGTAGVTGVYLGISAYITTTGGDITIGGGSDPYNFPVTAELGVSVDRSGRIWAGGGNISIRGDSVLNGSLNTADHQMKGVLITTPTISTTGSGTITIVANATGSANGRIADALYLDNGGSITSVDGAISVTAGNIGSGKTNGIYSPTGTSIAATGTGSINLIGDVRGTSTASSQAPAALSVYGLYLGTDSNVTTVDGSLSVRGYGGNFAASTALANIHSYGIYSSASKLLSTGSGTVNVYGLGGNIGNTVAAKAAFSIGIYNASWIGTTTANLTVEGVSGSVSGVVGAEYGYWSEVNTSAAANKNSASIISTTGSVTLIGDTAPNGATATGITVYGIYTSGAKVKSTSGNVSITGTVCSTCTTPEISTAAYGVSIKNNSTVPTWNEFLTGGSGTFTIVGHADNERNTTPTSYGINASFDSATRASLSTQTGALSLTGTATGTSAYGVYLGSNTVGSGLGSTTDGQFSISGTATGTSTYGILSNNYAFSTGSGGFNFSGSATSTSGAANGVSLSNSSATATSGATTINGTANSSGSAVGISPTTFGFASGSGSISLTGNATVNNNNAGGSAYGVAFNGASTTTTSGNVTILGNTYDAVNVYNNYGVRILTHPITTGAGVITLTGYANGATNSLGSTPYGLYSASALKTATGAITLYGEVPNLNTSQAVGLFLSASVTSGDAASTTLGGPISITGKTKMASSSLQHQISISGGSIDTYNNSIDLVAGIPTTVTNNQRVGLNLSGTETWGATASALNVTAHGILGSKALFQDESNVLNLGGPNSHADITFNVDQWNKIQTLTTGSWPITNIDTDGSVSILPIGTSFGPDQNDNGNAGAAMVTDFKPTTRVTEFTIGKAGNTRNLTLNASPSNTNPFNIDPNSGVLTIYAGTVTANYRVSAGTLAIESSGSVTMGTSTNAFTSVAVKRSAATGWNLANSASSWTAGTYGGVTGVYGVPSKLKASGSAPTTAQATTAMSAYSVVAEDAYGIQIDSKNTRSSDPIAITVSKKSGASTTLGGTLTKNGTAGSPTAFDDLTFSDEGTHTLAFDSSGFTQFVSQSITVSGAPQNQATLTIDQSSGTYGSTVTLTTTGGSGTGAVSFSKVSGTCSLSGNVLTLGNVGDSCMVTATKASSAGYNSATSASKSISTTQANQASLSLPSGAQIAYVASPGLDLATLTYGGGSGTGTGLTFSTATSGCTITGTVLTSTKTATQTCSIAVTKDGDTNYTAATSTFTVTVVASAQAPIVITSTTGTYGSTLSVTYSGGTGSGTASYSATGTCTVNSSGVVTFSSAGQGCSITVTKALEANKYLARSSAATVISVAKATQATFSWNLASTSVAYLGTLTLATTGGSGTGTVVYSASGDSTCSIVGTSLIPSDAGSTCEITATKVSDTNYNSADTATQTITVTKISQATLSFSNSNALVYGQTMDLLATGGSGGGSITYAVSNAGTTGCSLSANQLSVTGAGTCAVTAVRAASTNYNASSTATLSITVSKASQTVSFSSTIPAEPIAGDTYAVSATASSGLTPTITIASGPCSISNNVVTLTSAGNCVISVDSSSTNQYLAATTATQTVAIGQRNQTLTFSSTVRAMTVKTYGDPVFFADATTSEPTLTPVYSRGSATTNTACSVSSIGLVVILAVGNCEIEVNQAGDSAVAAASAIKKTFEVIPDRANAPFITSVSAGHESITAAFTAPNYVGGSAITGYQITAVSGSTTITNSACTLAGSGNTETCTINGLTNGTSYRIKVAAITAAGVGLYSDLSAARVPATNPAAVSAFTAVPDNTSIVLTWQDPVSLGGGTFDSYRVFYKLSSSANYPNTYITIQSQSPTNYTITGLVNGESYDVRIVTVTTANTSALVSNTAEVKETPRTVPEAPATVEVLEVGGQLVITWSTPQSDGGNAITEYRVTINGTTCTLANALDNLCTIAVPTNGGTYPIEVLARNDAGYGSAATATFTKAGVSSSGGSGGGSGSGSESSSNGQSAIQVLALSVKSLPNVGGQVVSITGKNLGAVTTILIDGIKAKIISVTDGLIKFTAPRNTDGPATLTLKSPTASAEVVDAFTYSKGIAKVKVAWVLGFVQANTTIKAADKAKLRTALQNNSGTVAVTCVGYQSYSYNTAKDAQTAMGRAKQACNYLKSVNPKLTVKSVIARTTLAGTPSRKLAVQFKTSK